MRLLLVEDDQNLSDVIAEHLQKEGYSFWGRLDTQLCS